MMVRVTLGFVASRADLLGLTVVGARLLLRIVVALVYRGRSSELGVIPWLI
jgi:hypothetical protein